MTLVALPATSQAASYTWGSVKIGGSGYVDGLLAHPGQQGLFYARTDVGGAYRYQASTGTWIALNDWTPASNWNIGGIETLAIDPRDTSRLYLVAGDYFSGSKGVFLSSSDQGATFQQVTLPFSTGANAVGRQVGERLQVDPNNGSVLFYGTGNYGGNASTNGLWTSTDRGATWRQVTGFPALSSDGTGAGVAFVAFFAGSAQAGQTTPTLFAGINTKASSASGQTLYRSNDGGKTWSVVNGGPSGVLPQRGQVDASGNLYLTYSAYTVSTSNGVTTEHYGPDGLTNGQVWKYNVYSGAWTNITPPNNGTNTNLYYGFSGLSVDPWRAGTLLVDTIDRYDSQGESLYRSTDGGATWTNINANASFDASAAPWTTSYGPIKNFGNWGDSVLDPYDTNHAFVTSGGGIFETKNLTATNTNWAYGENGVEETAITTVVSPPANVWTSYPLLSGGWDICGFVHASLTAPPSAPFTGPSCSKVTGLAFAGNDSRFVVRVEEDGWNSSSTLHYGAISWNGGSTWTAFPSNGATTKGGGAVAVNADGSAILWSPPDVAPEVSTSNAWSWTSLSGVLPTGAQVAADGYSASLFYAYDRTTGSFYSSGDKAATWAKVPNAVPGWGTFAATPGVQGDLWLVNFAGVYHDTSSGWGSWPKLANVSSATAIGFGKAAPGASYPAIYLAGTVGGVTGVFRSTDVGASWIRINDDQHQWGGTNTITGDPKTFGTVYLGTGNGRGIAYGTSPN